MQKEKGTITFGFDLAMRAVDPTNDDIESYDQACEKAISNGYSAMVDLTWGGWDAMQDVASANGFPYVRIDASNHQFIKVISKQKSNSIIVWSKYSFDSKFLILYL